MEEHPWWPIGIVQGHDDSSITTSWGTREMSIPEVDVEWWNSRENTWGEWPEIKSVELIKEDRRGMWYDIGDFVALVIPIPTGKHASRLARNPRLKADFSSHLQLPIAGLDLKSGDHVLVYPNEEPDEVSGERLVALHKTVIEKGWSTPNDEVHWNQRLKVVEDRLKTNTLWRAPHDVATIGMPRIDLQGMRPIPIPLTDSLLWPDELNLALLRQAVKHGVTDYWRKNIGKSYGHMFVLRSSTGGIAHMKYDINLMLKAESLAFGFEVPEVDEFLNDVDRYQANLGVMRLARMGIPLSLFGLLATWWSADAGVIESGRIGYITFALILIISFGWQDYLEPDWNQEL